MKRTIIKVCLSWLLVCPLLTFTSCKDWLDVEMSDNIMENTLYNTNQGFLIALNGIYVGMNDIYGSYLSASVIDVMAQYYNVTKNDDHAYSVYSYYEFDDETFENLSSNVWTQAYALLANVNVILEHCDKDGAALNESYYPLVKGEALALRAMIHFDMLRLYGPIYSEATASTICIPYQESSSKDIQPLLPASEVLDKVIRDLNAASELLRTGDPILTKGVQNAIPSDDGLDSYDMAYRQLRLNYYAVQALLARAYLWKGDKQEAYQIAKNEIIDKITTDNLEVFPWATEESFLLERKPDRLFSSEVFFAMYAQNRTIYSSLFSSALSLSSRLRFVGTSISGSDSKVATFYDDANDLRRTMWEVIATEVEDDGTEDDEDQPTETETSLYFLKYANPDADATYDGSETYCYMTPLIRLSEVYLIAAECAPTDDEALGYINAIREHRRCADASLQNGTRQELITREFAREVIGEGQLYFYYKRLGMEEIASGTEANGTYQMTLSNYVWPLPSVEEDKRTEIQF